MERHGPPTPPRLAELLVRVTCPRPERDAVLGDLAEEHDTIHRQGNPAGARAWYWRQALCSALPHLRRRCFGPSPPYLPAHPRSSFMSSLLQDLRYGGRMLRRRPLVSSIAALSLIVGISATTTVFSLLNAVAFRSLPVDAPGELRLVLEQRETGLNYNFSYQDFVDLRSGQRAFTGLAAYSSARVTLAQATGSELIDGEIVTGGFFSLLGVRMHHGRGLTLDDDRPDGDPVVVVGERLWQRLQTDTSAGIPGSTTILLNKQPFTVVGVAASPFRGMQIGRNAQVWAPLRYQRVLVPAGGLDLLERKTASWLTVFGRIRPETTDVQAIAELNRVERALPVTAERSRERTFAVRPGHQGSSMLAAATASPLQLLLAAAGLVLLIACANVAGLLLARAAERERELVLRRALGASRARLTRLLFAEAGLLGGAATAAAVGVATLMAEAAVPLLSRFGEPVMLDVTPDWRVLAFSAAIGIAATTAFGLAPVLSALGRAVAPAIADSGRAASAGRGRTMVRRVLVGTQFALSLALVFVALLFVRSLYNLHTMPTGFAIDRIALLAVDPEAARFAPPQTLQYAEDAVLRLDAVPGVEAVGFAMVEPLDFGGSRTSVQIPGYTPQPDEDMELNYNRVSTGYFDAMDIRPTDGRVFDGRDTAGAPPTLVVNETMARRFWPGTRAVGRDVRLSPTALATVIGVVPDVKYRMLRESPGPSFYLPAAQVRPPFVTFHVRTAGPPAAVLPQLRKALAEVDPAVPISRVRTLREQAAVNVNDDRLAMTIATALAGAALLLAAVGLYGAMAYAVGQRSREIGVRLALGAAPAEVRRLVLRQGVGIALAGSVAGIGLGLLCARAIAHRLFGVAPADVVTIAASVALLGVVAMVATWIPARRAASVDPTVALRAE
jgi:predicted permease